MGFPLSRWSEIEYVASGSQTYIVRVLFEDWEQGCHRLTKHTWHYDPLFTAVREYANGWYDERRMTTCEGQQGYLYALCFDPIITTSRSRWMDCFFLRFLSCRMRWGLTASVALCFGDPMFVNPPQLSRMRSKKQCLCFETCLS